MIHTQSQISSDIQVQPLVTLVDDDPDMRRSMARLLRTVNLDTEDYDSASAVLGAFDGDRPGCMVLDMRLPDRDGLDLLQEIRDRGIETPAIIITAFGDVASVVRAMKSNVIDFIEKPFHDQQFIASVQSAVESDMHRFQVMYERRAISEKIETLSARERDVLKGVVSGKSSKMIAVDLEIRQKTVDNYRASLMKKMSAENAAHLVSLVYSVMHQASRL